MTRLQISRKLFPISIGVLFAALGFLQTGKARATKTIFNNGAPSLAHGREMTLWVQAEDFTVSQNSLLNNVQFWTLEAPGAVWDGTVNYFLFQDIDGQPDTQPLVSGLGTNVLKTATNRSLFDYYNEFSYSFDLEKPVTIAADSTYWLGLHLSNNFDRDDIYWEATDSSFGTNGMSAYLEEFENWSRSSASVERAFKLTTSNTDSRKVPEPSIIFGTLLVGGAVLKSKKC
jgi:hypothetical protein